MSVQKVVKTTESSLNCKVRGGKINIRLTLGLLRIGEGAKAAAGVECLGLSGRLPSGAGETGVAHEALINLVLK